MQQSSMPSRVGGRYAIERVFKEDRQSGRVVALARDSTTGRHVVIKSDPVARHHDLFREAALLQVLQSRYVVNLLDTRIQGERLYIAIEFHHHETVSDLVKRHGGRIGPDRAIPIIAHLLEAFEAMHGIGYLHRDLHHKHISYRSRDDLKLFDLGMAIQGDASSGTVRWRNPHDWGTWETMAPEEYESGSSLTLASNVFSAATLLYALLSGAYPADYKRVQPDSVHLPSERQKQIQRDLQRSAQIDYSPIPRSLTPALERALSKRPQDRYQNAREFREALLRARS